jgi:hypothetical protein
VNKKKADVIRVITLLWPTKDQSGSFYLLYVRFHQSRWVEVVVHKTTPDRLPASERTEIIREYHQNGGFMFAEVDGRAGLLLIAPLGTPEPFFSLAVTTVDQWIAGGEKPYVN